MRNKGGSGGIDGRLKQRLEQYLSSQGRQYVDLAEVAGDLQKRYRLDYGRRNKVAFRIQVEKVYGAVLGESAVEAWEEKHLAKRARRSHDPKDGETDEDDDDSTDSEMDPPEPPFSDHMNRSLTTLYRKGVPAPGDKEENILIDLCEEDADSPLKLTDTSTLEPEQKEKKSKMKKGKRQKDRGRQAAEREPLDRGKDAKVQSRTPELQHPTVTFEDIGANEETLKEVCKLLIHMRHPEVYQCLGVVPPRGFLLHGPPGCGKTLLAHAVAGVSKQLLLLSFTALWRSSMMSPRLPSPQETGLPLLKVSAPELVSGVSGESEQKMRELFEQAAVSAPCILFIDEIDAITPKREVASKDMERRIVAQLLTCMDDLNSLPVTTQVLVIGATNRPDSLDPALRRAGRFDREICLGIPDEGARRRILETLCRKLALPEGFDFQRLARLTPGFVGADLMALCREAAVLAVNRALFEMGCKDGGDGVLGATDATGAGRPDGEKVPPPAAGAAGQEELAELLALLKSDSCLSEEQLAGLHVLASDFEASLSCVQPSAKREGFATVPDVTWADVGALQDVREELTMAILAPVRCPAQFKALGLSAPAGVLLAGPPGCGKTLLAKAVANESGLNFISVKGPELLNMYVGESERAVRQVFQRARNSSPCVIFFDEIDALCPRRSGHESGAGVRVVNQLLTEMDGLETRRQVFIMAATNRPDIIDRAVLRPGRLDKTLYVGLPLPEERHAILLTLTKGGTRPPLEPDVSLEEVAHNGRCDCFTGADLSALVREASVNALRRHLSCCAFSAEHSFTIGPMADVRVSRQDFEDAFKKVRPSISEKDRKIYEALKESLSR
ncbi:LOW QUALITY PROTEIN: nuclear valosin-containing protein-like [Paramormyrops kingsleyae]|uniref:LOW QUALITY PROTEIN: nuclear valosin-containing protein-like n=1 Tax=Paramormyrops kingsleyae TaxID=1676925 RepID=UPI003B96E782